jgi:hypothetical protein
MQDSPTCRMLRRLAALVLVPAATALLAAAPASSPQPVPDASARDHVLDLVGTWACRTMSGSVSHVTIVREGDTVTATADVRTARDDTYALRDRYTLDPGTDRWSLALGIGMPFAFTAVATPWTHATWVVNGVERDNVVVHLTMEWLPDGSFRRSFARSGRLPYSESLCRRGNTPPDSWQ